MWLFRELGRNKRGVGSILGAAFLVLILLSGYTSYTLYVKQVSEHAKIIQDMHNLNQKQNEESIDFVDISTTSEDKLNITIRNMGSYQAHLIWLGVYDETANTQEYYKINYYVNPSEALTNISNETVIIPEGQERTIQIVTELGNTFIYSYPPGGEGGDPRYDFVDEICGSSPIGTHTFFEAQQAGPDGICDTLIEGDAGGPGGGDWLSGWGARLDMTINPNDIDSGLSEFPVLVHLSDSSGKNGDDVTCIFDEVGSNRKKIAVTTGDGTTQCFVEIEKWDATSEEAWLWVKVPSISDTSITALYFYYDNSHADNTEYVGDSGSTPAQNVWDSYYEGVWHLTNEIEAIDSSGNDNNGMLHGPTAGQSGQVGLAYNFDGDDYVAIENLHYGSAGQISQLTVTAWVKIPLTGGDWSIIDFDRSEYYNCPAGIPSGSYNGEGDYVGFHTTSSGGTTDDMYSSGVIRDSTWHHVAWVFDSSVTNDKKIYVDGSLDSETDAYGTGTNLGSGLTRYGFIGDGSEASSFDGNRNDMYYEGLTDEIRISHSARSDAWINAVYEIGRDNLLDFGSVENYQLDLEVQWINVDYDEANEWLCIYGGTMGAEDILVDVWSGTDWTNVLLDLESGWNSVDVSAYLVSSTFKIRFRGGAESGDFIQDNWEIDATFLHVWT